MKLTSHRSHFSANTCRSWQRPWFRATWVVLPLLGVQGTAWAQDEDVRACAGAYEQAQVMRNSGKLRESEEQLRICVRDVCPDFVKIDCGQWLSDVRREMPSVILMVVDGSGVELSDVVVRIDGAAVTGTAGGTVFEVNPGPHEITFERQGNTRTEHVNIRQGEKNRVVKVEFASPVDTDADGIIDSQDACPDQAGDAANNGCAPATVVVPEPVGGLSDFQVGAIVAGGAGVLGMGTFVVAGLMSRNLVEDTKDKCNPQKQCPADVDLEQAERDESRLNLIANIGLGVGVAGLATGVVLLVLSSDTPPTTTETGDIAWQVAPTRGGAWMSLTTAF
jgi:hypothetical protein